uniref:PAR14-like first RRM domain-containing protein n=1 Tax=Cyprinus carpio TaxID=7962 RepID=A0A8C1MHD2_CYPCA
MDEYPYSIIVEGDWGPEHAKSVKNKLQIYFQSKKKSQGGDCVVKYKPNDGSNSATILFKSPDIRDGVLSKAEHIIIIDNQQIKLKVYKPSDVEEQTDNTGQRVSRYFTKSRIRSTQKSGSINQTLCIAINYTIKDMVTMNRMVCHKNIKFSFMVDAFKSFSKKMVVICLYC